MIQVELSNIWSCVSLPDLLSREQEVFDAHLRLRTNEQGEKPYLGWLGLPDGVTAKTLHAISKAAEAICTSCDTLVVVGNGGAWLGAQAGIELLSSSEQPMRVIFTGNDLSGAAWMKLCRELGEKPFCLQLIGNAHTDLEPAIASRALRWMLERRCGSDAKHNIFITAPQESHLARMAEEEGYTLLTLPEEDGASDSALTCAALLPMAVAGIDPLSVLEGAANAYQDMDIRAFENPAWMYAGARRCLAEQGMTAEMLGTFEPSLDAFGKWWQHQMSRSAGTMLTMHAALPAELPILDACAGAIRPTVVETMLRVGELCTQKVGIEMDWHDYDQMGFLQEKSLADVQQTMFEAICEAHADNGVPVMCVQTEDANAQALGELFYFFELTGALCTCMAGGNATGNKASATRELAKSMLGKGEM